MFSKNKTPAGAASANQQAPATQKKPAPPSVISADMRIVGDLVSTGETQIDGSVDGDIKSTDLLIGETANIKGEITADTLRVHGTVNGEIKATTVILASSANVIGNILHKNITIEKGARLEGHMARMSDSQEAATSDKKDAESRINLVAGGKDPKGATGSDGEGADSNKAKAAVAKV